MNRSNAHFERIIKRVLMEDEEIPVPPSGDDAPPPPPSQSTVTYSIVGTDGKTDPNKYTAEQLKTKNLKADSYVYNKTLGGWKKIQEVPELSGIVAAAGVDPTNKVSDDVAMDVPIAGAQKSFMEYCPTAKNSRDLALKAYNKQMETEMSKAADADTITTVYDKFAGLQGTFDKSRFLKPCMDELRITLKGQPELIGKYESALNQWMKKDGKELAKKALSAGGNVLLSLTNKVLKSKGLGDLKFENTLKKNLKSNLMEVYNQKNRRR